MSKVYKMNIKRANIVSSLVTNFNNHQIKYFQIIFYYRFIFLYKALNSDNDTTLIEGDFIFFKDLKALS